MNYAERFLLYFLLRTRATQYNVYSMSFHVAQKCDGGLQYTRVGVLSRTGTVFNK